jgi:hypothetical protein
VLPFRVRSIDIRHVSLYIYIPSTHASRRGKNNNLSAQRSNSNTVWFNFQTQYIYTCIKIFRFTRAHVTYYLKVDDRVSKLRAEYQLIFNIDFIRVGRVFFINEQKTSVTFSKIYINVLSGAYIFF